MDEVSGFCEQCGAPLASGVAFCEGCGAPVPAADARERTAEPTPDREGVPASPDAAPGDVTTAAARRRERSGHGSGRRRAWAPLALGAGGAVLVVVSIVSAL